MLNNLTRRRFLVQSGTVLAAISCPAILRGGQAPTVERISLKTLNPDRDAYLGWPTIAQTAKGELLVVCSGNRESHVCPFGQVWLYRSQDGGETWTWPQSIYDGPIDDRDAGILVTPTGTILVTSFTSLAYWDHGLKQEVAARKTGGGNWADERFAKWMAVHNRIANSERELGCWLFRSTDGGVKWDARKDSLVNSPHGPIMLSDGRIFYPGKELWKTPKRSGYSISQDDGATWHWGGEFPTRPGDNSEEYHELHGVETDSGKIVVQIRNHNKANSAETLQTESSDGGKTWATPHEIGVWGLPSHLLKLRDGRLLMTYGYRRQPFGNLARISENEGQTWSEPIAISDDGIGGDLGYPSTIQREDGTLVTVWYEAQAGSPKAVLRVARWKIT